MFSKKPRREGGTKWDAVRQKKKKKADKRVKETCRGRFYLLGVIAIRLALFAHGGRKGEPMRESRFSARGRLWIPREDRRGDNLPFKKNKELFREN